MLKGCLGVEASQSTGCWLPYLKYRDGNPNLMNSVQYWERNLRSEILTKTCRAWPVEYNSVTFLNKNSMIQHVLILDSEVYS